MNQDEASEVATVVVRGLTRNELTRLRKFRDEAIGLLRRADECRKHNWEPGEETYQVMNAIEEFLENETDG